MQDGDAWLYKMLDIPCLCPRDANEAIEACAGAPLTLKINSAGGDITAGAEIYTALWEYGGAVTYDIMGMAASEASVIAMGGAKAGNRCRMSPLALMMMHNVQTYAEGDYRAMEAARNRLLSANETIATAYTRRTGKTDDEVRGMMDNETWYSPREALAAGLIDEIMLEEAAPTYTEATEKTAKRAMQAMYSGGAMQLPPHAMHRMAAMWGDGRGDSTAGDLRKPPQNGIDLTQADLENLRKLLTNSSTPPPSPTPQGENMAELERANAMLALEKIRFGGIYT